MGVGEISCRGCGPYTTVFGFAVSGLYMGMFWLICSKGGGPFGLVTESLLYCATFWSLRRVRLASSVVGRTDDIGEVLSCSKRFFRPYTTIYDQPG